MVLAGYSSYIKQMTVRYIGKFYNKCEMCSKYTAQQYEFTPHKAIIQLLPEEDQKPMKICVTCAKRESTKIEWSEIKRK